VGSRRSPCYDLSWIIPSRKFDNVLNAGSREDFRDVLSIRNNFPGSSFICAAMTGNPHGKATNKREERKASAIHHSARKIGYWLGRGGGGVFLAQRRE